MSTSRAQYNRKHKTPLLWKVNRYRGWKKRYCLPVFQHNHPSLLHSVHRKKTRRKDIELSRNVSSSSKISQLQYDSATTPSGVMTSPSDSKCSYSLIISSFERPVASVICSTDSPIPSIFFAISKDFSSLPSASPFFFA